MGKCVKSIIFLFIFCILASNPIIANEFDYNKYSGNTALQNDFSSYMGNLQQKIQRNWTPPEFLEEGNTTVTFKITRRGEIISVDMVSSSNNELFDASALEAIRKSAPFDKFPVNSTRDTLTIKYNFHSSIVKTDSMKEYIENSDKFYNVDNRLALDYINLAIDEAYGDISTYFLYGKRSKIKRALGDIEGANADLEESKRLKAKFDKRQINSCKLIAEMENTPFAYFFLANTYDIAGDYEHAIEAIDKAIELTDLNNQYKRYRAELINKHQVKSTL